MVTEEIIIDGVNVAGCEFLRNCIIPDNYGCKIDDSLCCDVGNCYYKQLQRLKQENNSLEAELQNITVQSNNEITALKQENEAYKSSIIANLDRKISERYRELLDENEKLLEARNHFMAVNLKYFTALEEIKELNKHCADCEGNTCGVCAAADGKPNNSYRIANEALK